MRNAHTFDMTSARDRDEYAALVNNPAIRVEKSQDFFGLLRGVGEGDPGGPIVQRVVDVVETDAAEPYTPPY